jgi:hypothetical protein
MIKLSSYSALIAFCFLIVSCSHSKSKEEFNAAALNPELTWYGENRALLNEMLKKYGSSNPSYLITQKPVAIFDWDNTTIKNDVGDATFYWMLNHDELRHPGNWSKSNPYLTKAAVSDLNRVCPGKKAQKIKTTQNRACTDLLLSIYNEGKTQDGKTAAWNNTHPDTTEPSYLWTVQLMAGNSLSEVHAIAKQAIDFNLKNEIGTTQKVGSKNYPAYIRIYDQQKDLIRALKENGFEIWVATASAQPIVEEIAPLAGVDAHHVIGIRSMLDKKNRLTDRFEGCGPYRDGTTEITTYRLGKRCFINKVIFQIKDAKAQLETRSPSVFAAGDSDTDIFFVRDAINHFVINRNKPELMCNAYQNIDQHWIINPMFIEPRTKVRANYICTPYGLPDQVDAVF